jgi:RNA polymerase sigma factor (sigma-70 family)
MELQLPPDTTIVKMIAEDPIAFWGFLFTETEDYVCIRISKALSSVASDEDIEDAMMDFYTEVVPDIISHYDIARAPFTHYFNRSLTYFCMQAAMDITKRVSHEISMHTDNGDLIEIIISDEHGSCDIEGATNRSEIISELEDCVERLEPIYKEVFYLYMKQMSHSDIAAELGITPGNSRQRLMRAINYLRACLRKKRVIN